MSFLPFLLIHQKIQFVPPPAVFQMFVIFLSPPQATLSTSASLQVHKSLFISLLWAGSLTTHSPTQGPGMILHTQTGSSPSLTETFMASYAFIIKLVRFKTPIDCEACTTLCLYPHISISSLISSTHSHPSGCSHTGIFFS